MKTKYLDSKNSKYLLVLVSITIWFAFFPISARTQENGETTSDLRQGVLRNRVAIDESRLETSADVETVSRQPIEANSSSPPAEAKQVQNNSSVPIEENVSNASQEINQKAIAPFFFKQNQKIPSSDSQKIQETSPVMPSESRSNRIPTFPTQQTNELETTPIPAVEKTQNSPSIPVSESNQFTKSDARSQQIPEATPSSPSKPATETIPVTPSRGELPFAPTSNTPNAIAILSPTAGTVLKRNSSEVVIQFPHNASVELRINDVVVDPSFIGRTETDLLTGVIKQIWYGVVFAYGKNNLTLKSTIDGVAQPDINTEVIVPSQAVKMKLETVEKRIPADGLSKATIRGTLLDRDGNIALGDAIVTLTSNGGEFLGVDEDLVQPGFQVKATKGEFSAIFRSGIRAQIAQIMAATTGLEAYAQIQLETALRKQTLLTGVLDFRLGNGLTNFHGSLRDFLPPDGKDSWELDATTAVFATGSLGEWQFTGAFNSDRALNKDCDCENRLFRNYQDPEKGYPTYGDKSTSEVVAPSIDNLYLRFERSSPEEWIDPDYGMWGDFRTEEFATTSQEFSSMSRDLHGFKANYNWGNLQITGLYANNIEGFQRDTIVPDGTSGYYFLSRRNLISGSEDIYLELEKFNSPGSVQSRERLTIGTDYEIDYDRGTIIFKKPISPIAIGDSAQTLVRRIVVTYQFEQRNSDTDMYGTRLRYHFDRQSDRESWLGATYLQENKSSQDFQLYGFDALIALGNDSKVIAEFAHSENGSELSDTVDGSAYRLDWQQKLGEKITSHAYYRQAEKGFNNNATISFVPGQTRYGVDVQAEVSKSTNLKLQYEHEDNFGVAPRPIDTLEEFLNPLTEPIPGTPVDNSLSTITAGVQQQIGEQGNLNLDVLWRDRQDRLEPNALTETSTQLRSYLTLPLSETIDFNALNETTISNRSDPVFGDRMAIGLDWEFIPGIKLNLGQQWFTRGENAGKSLTSLGVSGEYHPWEQTTLNARYAMTEGSAESGGTGSLGINQKIDFTPSLHADLNYEHTFTSFTRTGSGTQFSQPFAYGQGTSALSFDSGDSYSIGLDYATDPDFKAGIRWEHRDSSQGTNTVWSANVSGKPSPALTALMNYRQASSANQSFSSLGTTKDFKLGLAYRDPKDDRFNALLKYQYEENPSIIPESILFEKGSGTEEHTVSLEGIYAPNWRWEFYGKYALRNSTTHLAQDFEAESTVSLAQLRATYKLNYNIDIAAEGRIIWQPSTGYKETGLLLEAGYYFTPELRFALGYAFGEIDDRSFSGNRSDGGVYFGLTVKLSGLLDGFNPKTVTTAKDEQKK
jgi:hypothetical protein